MKTTLMALFALIVAASAHATTQKIQCSSSNKRIRVQIDSFCPLPESAERSTGTKMVRDAQRKSTISIYRDNKLASKESYNCTGIEKDETFFTTYFKNEKRDIMVTVMDDWGLDYKMWIDLNEAERLTNCIFNGNKID